MWKAFDEMEQLGWIGPARPKMIAVQAEGCQPVVRAWKEGADPPSFHFDLSYNLYPPEYHRPGPTVRIYRLDDCRQASGPPVIRIPQAKEPAPVF